MEGVRGFAGVGAGRGPGGGGVLLVAGPRGGGGGGKMARPRFVVAKIWADRGGSGRAKGGGV